ncbi:hypothetical protein, partial [Streptomyces afghaniensis]|uniref:hypothetical protein n=1 Tax=Streptomyces afghaniensis TaxID=66865 RepID=UPI002468B7B0
PGPVTRCCCRVSTVARCCCRCRIFTVTRERARQPTHRPPDPPGAMAPPGLMAPPGRDWPRPD